MSAPSSRGGQEPADHPDEPGVRARHDEHGRSRGTPYVPAGRTERGRPVPGVPHEGFLGRVATVALLGQSLVLAVLAVWAFVAIAVSPQHGPVEILTLSLTVPHGVLLAATAVLGAAACSGRRWARRWSAAQFVVYLAVFFVGMTVGTNQPQPGWLTLNASDHILHVALALLGFVTAMLLGARIVEPPPGDPPYPRGRTDAPELESDR